MVITYSPLLVFFYLFASLALVSAIMVILSSNPVYSALFLILVFFNTSLVVLLLDLEFLALIFILIYIGAIMVLFLFILMMLDIKHSTLYLHTYYYFLTSGLFLVLLSSEFLYVLSSDWVYLQDSLLIYYVNWFNLGVSLSSIKALGTFLYTQFSFFFIVSGAILLVAMLGAISLTFEPPRSIESKHQLLSKQLSTTPSQCVFYLK